MQLPARMVRHVNAVCVFVFSILFLLLQGQEEEREKKWRTWVDERFVKVRVVLHLNFHKPKAVYYFVRRF